MLVMQSSPTVCSPMDCSPPASSDHEILQARILEWVAIPFSKGSSQPRDQTCVFCISCIGRRILYHWATWEAPTGNMSRDPKRETNQVHLKSGSPLQRRVGPPALFIQISFDLPTGEVDTDRPESLQILAILQEGLWWTTEHPTTLTHTVFHQV